MKVKGCSIRVCQIRRDELGWGWCLHVFLLSAVSVSLEVQEGA